MVAEFQVISLSSQNVFLRLSKYAYTRKKYRMADTWINSLRWASSNLWQNILFITKENKTKWLNLRNEIFFSKICRQLSEQFAILFSSWATNVALRFILIYANISFSKIMVGLKFLGLVEINSFVLEIIFEIFRFIQK